MATLLRARNGDSDTYILKEKLVDRCDIFAVLRSSSAMRHTFHVPVVRVVSLNSSCLREEVTYASPSPLLRFFAPDAGVRVTEANRLAASVARLFFTMYPLRVCGSPIHNTF